MNSAVNPSPSVPNVASFNSQSEFVTFNREAPPPYSAHDFKVIRPVLQPTVVIQPTIKDKPVYYTCPHCEERILTKVEYSNTRKTHMLAGFVCGFTLWCCLCCFSALPYVTNTFKIAKHYCPNCNWLLGAFSRI